MKQFLKVSGLLIMVGLLFTQAQDAQARGCRNGSCRPSYRYGGGCPNGQCNPGYGCPNGQCNPGYGGGCPNGQCNPGVPYQQPQYSHVQNQGESQPQYGQMQYEQPQQRQPAAVPQTQLISLTDGQGRKATSIYTKAGWQQAPADATSFFWKPDGTVGFAGGSSGNPNLASTAQNPLPGTVAVAAEKPKEPEWDAKASELAKKIAEAIHDPKKLMEVYELMNKGIETTEIRRQMQKIWKGEDSSYPDNLAASARDYATRQFKAVKDKNEAEWTKGIADLEARYKQTGDRRLDQFLQGWKLHLADANKKFDAAIEELKSTSDKDIEEAWANHSREIPPCIGCLYAAEPSYRTTFYGKLMDGDSKTEYAFDGDYIKTKVDVDGKPQWRNLRVYMDRTTGEAYVAEHGRSDIRLLDLEKEKEAVAAIGKYYDAHSLDKNTESERAIVANFRSYVKDPKAAVARRTPAPTTPSTPASTVAYTQPQNGGGGGSQLQRGVPPSGGIMGQFNSLIAAGKTVILKFGSHSCGPCQTMDADFASLQGSGGNVVYFPVDVNSPEARAMGYTGRSIPEIHIRKGGMENFMRGYDRRDYGRVLNIAQNM